MDAVPVDTSTQAFQNFTHVIEPSKTGSVLCGNKIAERKLALELSGDFAARVASGIGPKTPAAGSAAYVHRNIPDRNESSGVEHYHAVCPEALLQEPVVIYES